MIIQRLAAVSRRFVILTFSKYKTTIQRRETSIDCSPGCVIAHALNIGVPWFDSDTLAFVTSCRKWSMNFFFFFFFQLIARLINVETLFSRVSPFVRPVSSTSQHEVGDFCRGSSRYRYVRAFTFKVLICSFLCIYLSRSRKKLGERGNILKMGKRIS